MSIKKSTADTKAFDSQVLRSVFTDGYTFPVKLYILFFIPEWIPGPNENARPARET
jgi:hypothetical protein